MRMVERSARSVACTPTKYDPPWFRVTKRWLARTSVRSPSTARTVQPMTQYRLAKRMGLRWQQFCQLKKRYMIDLDQLVLMARLMEAPVADFVADCIHEANFLDHLLPEERTPSPWLLRRKSRKKVRTKTFDQALVAHVAALVPKRHGGRHRATHLLEQARSEAPE